MSKSRVLTAVGAASSSRKSWRAVIHGFVLAADYDPYEGTLLRSGVAWQMLFPPVAHLSFVFALAWVATRLRLEGTLVARGLALGVVGWAMGQVPLWLIWYAEQPWPGSLVVKQLGLELAASVVVGLTIALFSPANAAVPQQHARPPSEEMPVARSMKKYTFKAEIRAGTGGGAYVVFPYDAEKSSDERQGAGRYDDRRRAVQGRVVPDGNARSHAGRAQIYPPKNRKGPGDIVAVVLWKDDEPREVAVPPELKARMKKAGVLPFFESLSFTHRKEYSRWIAEAKKDETRARRLDKTIELLTNGVRSPR